MKGRRRFFALAVAAVSVAADTAGEVANILNSCEQTSDAPSGTVTIEQKGQLTVLVKASGAEWVWVKDTDDEYFALKEYEDNGGAGMLIGLTRMPGLMFAEAWYEPACTTRTSDQIESWDTVVSTYVASDRSPPPGDWEELKPEDPLYKRINCNVDQTNCLLPVPPPPRAHTSTRSPPRRVARHRRSRRTTAH